MFCLLLSPICSVVYESQSTAAVYETVTDVRTDPHTTQNVAYGLPKKPSSTQSHAYEDVPERK